MDRHDRRILALLQEDSSMSHADIAQRVHLSASQCSRRIQRLLAEGYIRKQVALLDPEKLGLTVEAYVTVTLSSYEKSAVAGFHDRIRSLPDIVECCAMTGDTDYMLRIMSRDLRSFTRLINEDILGVGDVANVRSSIVLDHVKRTTALPIAGV